MISAELHELVCLARDRTQNGRNKLLNQITNLLLESDRSFNSREQTLVNDILKKLIQEVERPIRSALAQLLADMKNAPPEIVLVLANEDIDIAAPILMKSKFLLDHNLVDIIESQTERHQLAIALREQISPVVSAALVATESREVIQTLLENNGAELSQQTMAKLVQQSRSMVDLQQPLLRRRELNFELAAKMYIWVSQALRAYIVNNFPVDASTIDPIIANTIANEFSQYSDAPPETKAMRTANLLAEKGELTGNLLLETLKQTDIELFETLFAKMAAITPQLAHHLIYANSPQGITVAAKEMGLDRAEFTSLFLSLDRANKYAANAKPLNHWLKLFDRLNRNVAKRVLEKWQNQLTENTLNSSST